MNKKDYEALYKVVAEKNAKGNIIDEWFRYGNGRAGIRYEQFKEKVLSNVEELAYTEEEVVRLEKELEAQEEKYNDLQIDIRDIVDDIHLLRIDEEDKAEFEVLVNKLYKLAK